MQATVIAVALPLVAAGSAHLLLHFLARAFVARGAVFTAEGRRGAAGWAPWAFRRIVSPLALLIWVPAAHAAATAFLPAAASPEMGAVLASALDGIRTLGVVAAVLWLGIRGADAIEAVLVSLAARTANAWDDALLPLAGRAVRILLPIAAFLLIIRALPVPEDIRGVLQTATSLGLIAAAAFLLYQSVDALTSLVLTQYRLDVADNIEARAIHTQVVVLKKIATTVIVVIATGAMLMVFEPVRQFGASILASAGIAGIVVGLAAQRSIATMLAGLQIALTQPIRLDDVVIVDGEWGRIEDITLTYVTVRIWDQRRLIVPITRFIEQPFENWTRRSAEITGSVFLHVDYRTPLELLRAEFRRVLADSPYWDGKVGVLQVTDAREHTVEVRALASAADASLAWDLRCEVREKLVTFLQREHPDSLPRVRTEWQRDGSVIREVATHA